MNKIKIFTLISLLSIGLNSHSETLKMGINHLAPPYSFQDEKGNLVGFEIELIDSIGKEMGFNVIIEPVKFVQIFPRLESGEYDIAAHIYSTAERAEKYNLVQLYSDELKFIALKSKSTDKTEPLVDSAKVSVIHNGSHVDKLNELKKSTYPNLEIIGSDTNFLAFKNLFLNKSEIFLVPYSEMNHLINNYKEHEFKVFDASTDIFNSLSVNYATKKDNTELAKRIASGLEIVKSKGIYDELRKKYNL